VAFTVEDGTLVAGANALASVADVDSYWSDRGGNTAWSVLSTAQKQAAIIKGTAYVGDESRYLYRGTKRGRMVWPRTGAVERFGQPIADTTIPWQIKDAVAVLAARSGASEALLPDIKEGIESVGAGSARVQFRTDKEAKTKIWEVEALLGALLKGGINGIYDIPPTGGTDDPHATFTPGNFDVNF